MALFKISKGLKANLPSAKTAGHCWYTVDDSLFYIDYEDESGKLQRKALNAKDAETLTGASLSTILNASDIQIPTSNAVLSALAGKSDTSHTHDDRYYTEEEVTKKLASKSDTTHKHDDAYDAKGAAEAVQKNLDAVSDEFDEHVNNSNIHVTAANKTNWSSAYTHSQSAHARVDATKVADSTTNGNILINDVETNVYSHPNSGVTAGTYKSVTVNAQGHVTAGSNPTTLAGYGITDAPTKTEAQGYATAVKNELLNGAGAAYDTLKELGALIDDNTSAIDALEKVASGKADKEHGTHVTYSTTAPVMDGTASVGSASTVARSDHKHPTDTSRAAKADFDSHIGNTTVHITSTERTNWNAAKTHADSAHAPSNAEKNQNAFSNIAVSGQTTVAADTATDTVTFVGSNVTITTDVTNDNVTFAVADGSTSAKGIVQLTNSTSSTSTTTAATPNSVKSAYDLANSAYDLADSIVYVGPTAPTDPNVKVWINTSEEGTGVVPVLPRVATITLAANKWSGSAEPYSQQVTIATATTASKIDLQPTAQQIVSLQNAEISLMIENNGGVFTCYALGNKPTIDYTMQVLIQEVAYV
jgi:hypothetical protein